MTYKEDVDEELDDNEQLSQYERWFNKMQAKQYRGKAADEFERFINAPPDRIVMPLVDWWLQPTTQRTYPRLSKMAIDILSATARSAESERVFSAARRTIPWTRARLGGELIARLECLRHWQRTGVIPPDFVLDIEAIAAELEAEA